MRKKNIVQIVVDPDDPRTFPASQSDIARLEAMTEADVVRAALEDPDAQPLTDAELAGMVRPMDARSVRGRLGLSQAAFSERFGLELTAVRAWDMGRLDASARALLRIIDREPEAAARAAAGGRRAVAFAS